MKNDPSTNWWWKKINIRKRDDEAAAFYYELARRNFDLKKYPSFNKLKIGEHDIAFPFFSRKFAGWKKPLAIVHLEGMDAHGDYVSFPKTEWNLRESNHALQKAFLELIESERIRRGISESEPTRHGKDFKGCKSRNAGNLAKVKSKGQPWEWLELMDNPHGLNSNDRSHLAAARKKCASIKNDFVLLWKEIEQHRAFLECYYREHPQALQIDREPVEW
jgi:hypothetical protein